MQKKFRFIILISWLTFITLAFFSDYSNPHLQSEYSKNTPIEIAFSNLKGPLSKSQSQNIQQTMQQVQTVASQLGIEDIKVPQQNFITRYFQNAPDHSTVTYQITLNKKSDLSALKSIIQTSRVTTQISESTHPSFEMITNFTVIKVSLLIGFAIISGLYFRSLFAPIIITALSIIASTGGWFLAHLWSTFFHLPTTTLTEIIIDLCTLVFLPLCIILLLRTYCNHFETDPHAVHLLNKWRLITFKPLILMIILGSLFLTTTTLETKSISYFIPLLVLVWLLVFTLLPVIIAIVEDLFFWPSPPWIFESEHHSWYFLTKFARQHLRICSTFLLFLLFSISLSHISTPKHLENHASKFIENHLNSDFNQTINIKLISKSKFQKTDQFSDIDQLTKQLKQNRQVQSVCSITQPLGKSWTAFSLKKYLTTTTDDLTAVSDSLESIQDENTATLDQLQKSNLDALKTKLDILDQNIDINTEDIGDVYNQDADLIDNLDQSTDQYSDFETISTLNTTKSIIKKLKINLKNIAILKQNSKIIASEQDIISENMKAIDRNVRNLKTSLKQLTPKLSTTLTHIQSTNQNLGELSRSSFGNTFYISKKAVSTPLFHDAQEEYLSHNGYTTLIKVELKQNTDAIKYFHHLQNMLPGLVQATSLQQCHFKFSGVPMQQISTLLDFKKDFKRITPIALLLLVLSLAILTPNQILNIIITIMSCGTSLLTTNILTKVMHVEVSSTTMLIFLNMIGFVPLLLFALLIFAHQTFITDISKLLNQVDQIINLVFMSLFVVCGALLLSHTSISFGMAFFLAIALSTFCFLFPLWTTILYKIFQKKDS